MSGTRSDLRGRLTDGLYGLGWGAVKKLPEPAAAALFRSLADQVWKRRGKSVLRLESNLARVVPDADAARLAELSRAGMRSYMRYWMESFRLPTWSPERIKASIDVRDAHRLTEGLDAGRGSSSRCRTSGTGTWRARGSPRTSRCRSRRSPSG